jgi:hypothetical protein
MIVVNFATEQYKRPQQRLAASLFNKGAKALIFDKYEDIDSPTHQQSPYEFKIHAIRKAFEHDDVVLWADSSFYLVGDISIIEEIIKRDGFFGSEAGHYAGDWTNQHTRNYFKTTDVEMGKGEGCITLFSAGLLGIHLKNEKAMRFLYEWEASAKAGCFKGSWTDHRHDQSCASIIATRLGFKYQRGGKHMSYIGPGYAQPEKDSIFHLQGMV